MASSQKSGHKSVYNDKFLKSRIKLKRFNLTVAEGIRHPKASQYGKTIVPVGNMTPIELSMETELLPHTQLKTQNFISINPSQVKPKQPPKVNMVPFFPDTIVVPVLRVNDLDGSEIITVLSAFLSPFVIQKFTPVECSNIDVFRAWCTPYGSLDRDFSNAVRILG